MSHPKDERAILVYLHLRHAPEVSDVHEFRALAKAAGAQVIDTLSSVRTAPDAQYCIGTGKVETLRALVAAHQVDLVLFDYTLTPTQERNLERILKCRVLDRTGLILDIFAQRARTYEGKLQVELAQLKNNVSRLVRGWTHLERQKGGIGLRGPGETQLETDRRLIKARIKHIQLKLEKVRKQREQGRRARQKAALYTVSLVGYTNAGKSTLFNSLTGSEVWVEDQLFVTLDPTLRAVELPPLGRIVCADTVGFIRQLPHSLIEAFHATLEETKDADLLLHVMDSQDELRQDHRKQVERVLEEIGALAVPIIEVYNKIDLTTDVLPKICRDSQGVIRAVFMSAATGAGLDLLQESIIERLTQRLITGELCLLANQYQQRALLFNSGAVVKEVVDEAGSFKLQICLPYHKWEQLCRRNPELGSQLEAR